MDDTALVADFSLAIAPAEVPRLRSLLAADGRVRVSPVLAPEAAQALRQELIDSTAWVRTMRQGNTERELEAATLAALSPAHLAALEQLARQGDETVFRFLHDAIRIPSDSQARKQRGMLLDSCSEALNSAATLDLVSELTETTVRSFRGDATRYLPGHFLTTHNDGHRHGRRVLAFVLNLSDWHIDWGGLMLFHDDHGDAKCAWTPRFNSANLFSVPQYHSVSCVTPLARAPRLTVSGWFYAD